MKMELYIFMVSIVSLVSGFKGNTITDEVDCYAPRDPGTCEGQEEAWYYLPNEDKCAFFVYSGCGGTSNRFTSRGNCESACLRLPKCPKNDCPPSCTTTSGADGCDICACTREQATTVCNEPAQRGYCRAMHYKWAWDANSKHCIQFVYGGCEGNENNFETEERCLEICQGI
ncbi:hypothetical protein SK128_007777 [Halocaridina rubra]|uniref:BPTI/Kunitz inhibitor domain-containing protein n=1 Tax=Halocaridina rubra TaxID=373956 RepID=A0AAN9ADM9_HALRR